MGHSGRSPQGPLSDQEQRLAWDHPSAWEDFLLWALGLRLLWKAPGCVVFGRHMGAQSHQ